MARDLSSINKVRDLNLITVDIPKKEGCKNRHNPIHKGPLVLGPKTIHFVIQSPSQGLSPVSKDATTASFNQTPFPLCISVLSHYHASTLSLSLSVSEVLKQTQRAMASLAATVARRAASLSRMSISTPKTPIQPSSLTQRRNLAGAAGNFTFFVSLSVCLDLLILRSQRAYNQNISFQNKKVAISPK